MAVDVLFLGRAEPQLVAQRSLLTHVVAVRFEGALQFGRTVDVVTILSAMSNPALLRRV